MKLKIGCCGFPVAKQRYFKKLKLVETQQTFYNLPRLSTAQAWRSSAPDDFEFTMKAWQLITHHPTSPTYGKTKTKIIGSQKNKYGSFQPTDEVFKAWEETEKIAAILKARVIVFQCPPAFTSDKNNKDNLRKFFRTVKRKKYGFVWEPGEGWPEREVKKICEDLDLIHCADPFKGRVLAGDIRYFRLHGKEGYRYRYKGWDLKKLKDFCEDESKRVGRNPVYVLFNNISMMGDAQRFEWIAQKTGRLKDLNLTFLQSLCGEIEAREEDEKVQLLSREAEKIVSLILHTDYAKVDIDIEKNKLKDMCKELFPGKEYLYEMIYGQRFDRLWEQFRENKEREI